MKIAIFDHLVDESNAIGKCHLQLLSALADEHEFTVFAIEFDNPRPDRIKFVKVPALRRPLLGLMITFHIIAPLMLWWYRQVKGERYDLVQGIGGNFVGADLAYGHFCHHVYLREHPDARPKAPIRRLYSWVYDSIVSMLEPIIYRRARHIVTPSRGLANELKRNFVGAVEDKIHVIANPVNVSYMVKPSDFDPMTVRRQLGFQKEDLVMVFVGAGHFERKGLPILLKAMQQANNPQLKLIVVGGRKYMIQEYKHHVHAMYLREQVQFVGYQSDIRPYLWSSDVFAFPSAYEIFPLVSLEAAAAGLPLLSAPLYGVEEFLRDGINGWQVQRTPEAFAEKMLFALENREQLVEMGHQAADSVAAYTPDAFGNNWRRLYGLLESKLVDSHPTRKDFVSQV